MNYCLFETVSSYHICFYKFFKPPSYTYNAHIIIVYLYTVLLFTVDTLPFGGVGMSGMGSYHGKYGFDTFTHKKSCLGKNLALLGEKMASLV